MVAMSESPIFSRFCGLYEWINIPSRPAVSASVVLPASAMQKDPNIDQRETLKQAPVRELWSLELGQ